MKDLAKKYYNKGYNCCEAIILAANKKYNLDISKKNLKFCSCLNNGIGIGSLCGGVIAGIMIIGYIFEKNKAPEHSDIKHIRMAFVDKVNDKLGSINCCKITELKIAKNNCCEIIGIIAECLDRVIREFNV